MAHDNQCQNCGKSFTGNMGKRFCSDACRKYYKRHGNTSLTGLKPVINADKAGQVRTTPRSGGSNIADYAVKKGIDLLYKLGENKVAGAKPLATTLATTASDTPLQCVNAQALLADTADQLERNRVYLSPLFSAFLGPIVFPFKALVWGLPGSGKSTFCLQLANELAVNHQLLYIAGEEALTSPTLIDKQKRTIDDLNAYNCSFLNRLPKNEVEWKTILTPKSSYGLCFHKAIFYDSVTKLSISPFYVNAAAHDFTLPELAELLSHIFITHAHKDGQQYRGDGSWGHEVDIVIRVEKGVATTQKNRFGEVGRTLQIF